MSAATTSGTEAGARADTAARGAISTAARAVTTARSATVAHYLSLAAAAIVLTFLSRNQWFFYDEWAFITDPTAELWAGHGGHWSTLPILVWTGLQSTFGLASYLPFVLTVIAVHLVTAHLLWRLLRRLGSSPWIATALAAVFLFLGAGAENLFWAFQYAFVGAITFVLGAMLLALRPKLGRGARVGIAVLLLAGAATSGTALPFFLPVVLVLWRNHGWRKMLWSVVPPALVYVIWYLFVAGPNPNRTLQAQGADILLSPSFGAAMFVNGLSVVVPVPFVGIIIVAIIALGLGMTFRSGADSAVFGATALALAGVGFALLTGFSRWGTGLGSATNGRYIYVLCIALAPAAGLLLTRFIGRSRGRATLAFVLIGTVGLYNVGLLVADARYQAGRETTTHEVVSAALAMQEQFPEATDLESSPDPTYLPIVDLGQLKELHLTQGLPVREFSESAWLTAVVNSGVTVTSAAAASPCVALRAGDRILSTDVVVAGERGEFTVAATNSAGETGNTRALRLDPGAHRIAAAADTPLVVTAIDPRSDACIARVQEQ
jgi:hypothetical protein